MNEKCYWELVEDIGWDWDRWETSCDSKFVFDSDGPEENEFVYCPYCGKEIEVVGK